MELFTEQTIESFNKLNDCQLTNDMTFHQASENIEKNNVSYFYISGNSEDVLEAIEDEKEIAEQLNLDLIVIKELDIYIATY